jgi:hypothetical protein
MRLLSRLNSAPLTELSCFIGWPIGAPVAPYHRRSVPLKDHDRMRLYPISPETRRLIL